MRWILTPKSNKTLKFCQQVSIRRHDTFQVLLDCKFPVCCSIRPPEAQNWSMAAEEKLSLLPCTTKQPRGSGFRDTRRVGNPSWQEISQSHSRSSLSVQHPSDSRQHQWVWNKTGISDHISFVPRVSLSSSLRHAPPPTRTPLLDVRRLFYVWQCSFSREFAASVHDSRLLQALLDFDSYSFKSVAQRFIVFCRLPWHLISKTVAVWSVH